MKKVISLIVSSLIFSSALNAQSFSDYKQEQSKEYKQYKESLKDDKEEFLSFKEAYDKAYKDYVNSIVKNFGKEDISTQKVWVEYNKDFDTKKKVDFENEEVTFEVVAKNENEAKEKILKLSKELEKESVDTAYLNDQLEQQISELTGEEREENLKGNVISDAIEDKYVSNKVKDISTDKFVKAEVGEKFVYKLNVKLPSDFMIKKARLYKDDVLNYSRKNQIPPELTYAIIHTESAFNPMARSQAPAYGLMQIVPSSAGVDTTYYLSGEKTLLSPKFLYHPKKNILIGSTYLHLLYYNYLSSIDDPISRMYCAISAYNTGAGNVARAFTKNTSVVQASEMINGMKHQAVYNHLIKNLPYNETRDYLVKVNERVSMYKKLLGDGI